MDNLVILITVFENEAHECFMPLSVANTVMTYCFWDTQYIIYLEKEITVASM